jgi:hypothetical protein
MDYTEAKERSTIIRLLPSNIDLCFSLPRNIREPRIEESTWVCWHRPGANTTVYTTTIIHGISFPGLIIVKGKTIPVTVRGGP